MTQTLFSRGDAATNNPNFEVRVSAANTIEVIRDF